MAHAIKQVKFKVFDKYNFVKSFVAAQVGDVNDLKIREQKEKEAAIIADAIEENQNIVFENLATKDELQLGLKALELSSKKDLEIGLKALEYRLTIRLTAIMAALLTFLPIATDFVRHLFKFQLSWAIRKKIQ